MNRSTKGLQLYWLADRGALAKAIQRAVDRRFGGNLSAASRRIGLSQAQLCRLSKVGGPLASGKRLNKDTLKALKKIIPRHILAAAILTPEGQIRLRTYREWMREKAIDLETEGADPDGDFRTFKHERMLWRYEGRTKILRHLKSMAGNPVPKFIKDMKEHGHSRLRVRLAVARAVDILLDAERSGGIERSVKELDKSEVVSIVKSGLDRERILLKRVPDEQRASKRAHTRANRGSKPDIDGIFRQMESTSLVTRTLAESARYASAWEKRVGLTARTRKT